MNKKYRLGKYIAEIDVDATHKWYAGSEAWECDCSHCQIFLALVKSCANPSVVRSASLPSAFSAKSGIVF